MTTKTTTKTLTDDDGDNLDINLWTSGRVTLVTRQGNRGEEVGPFDPADLIAAIREVAGEADDKPEPAPSKSPTAEDFARAEFARHEDGRFAARTCDDDTPWCVRHGAAWRFPTDAAMAAEGWQIVTPAEDSISRAELDARLARRDGKHKRQVARMQRHIETVQRHLARRREQMDQMREQMEAMTPAPSTPREALALVVDLAYEVEGDTMPDQRGYMRVGEGGVIHVYPDSNPRGLPARGPDYRRLLLDPPASKRPEWADADWLWAETETGARVIWEHLTGDPGDEWWTWADRTLHLDEMAERRPVPVAREEVEA